MATLHFICGKAGAGKTTLARELGRTLPALVICEDEWLHALGFEIRTVDDYRAASGRFRVVIDSLVPDILTLGTSVVLDYAANTIERRAWLRSLSERAGAQHVLHWIEGTDAECLDNIHRRNDEKPEGVYFGQVSDALFHAVSSYFQAPSPEEGFNVIKRQVHVRG